MGYIGAGVTRFNTADELTVTGDAQIDTTTLVVDSTNDLVGVRVASPDAPLQIGTGARGASSATFRPTVLIGDRPNADGNANLEFSPNLTTGNAVYMSVDTSKNLKFGRVDSGTFTETVRIDSSGNVGIGESNPSLGSSANGLHITGASGNDGVLKLDSSDTTHSGKIQFTENGTDQWRIAYDPTNNHLEFTESGVADRMVIADGGNVGIGTSSPSTLLHLSSTSPRITLTDTDTGADHRINADSGAGNLAFDIDVNSETASPSAVFNIKGSEAMRIDSSGNLNVGKTASGLSTAGLSLRGDADVAQFTRDGNAPLEMNRLTSDGEIVGLYKDGTTVGSIGAKGGDLIIGTGDVGIRFNDANDALRPTDQSTGSGRDNAIDIGDSGNRWKDLYLSGGAYIGGTAAANKLDDYEEGDFTPAIWEGTSAISDAAYNTSFTKGTYIKIGRMVMLTMSLRLTSKGTPTGSSNFRIGGFPFTTTNDVKARSAFATYDHDATGINTTGNTTGTLHAFISNGVNYLGFRVSDPSQATAETLTYDDLGNDTYLQLTGTIVVD